MDSSSLQHVLTVDERRKFEADGYFVVERALTLDHLTTLINEIDGLYAGGRFEVGEGSALANRVDHVGFMAMSPKFVDLIDHPRTFPKVWGVLGWNIYGYTNHLVITPQAEGRYDPDGPTYRFHQDSGRATSDMPELDLPARLSLKVGYFLSDASEPGRGNLWVVPGSHLKKSIELPPDGVGQPEGAMPVCAEAGDAVIFDRRLWHAATPNYSRMLRRFLVYGYGYRWIRFKGDIDTPEDVRQAADPIRKQLLGVSRSATGGYRPDSADAPLREWLREHHPDSGAD